jgi:ATP-dependent DNA ligase
MAPLQRRGSTRQRHPQECQERELCHYGRDLRPEAIETRKALLAKLVKGDTFKHVLDEHFEEHGATVFRESLPTRL